MSAVATKNDAGSQHAIITAFAESPILRPSDLTDLQKILSGDRCLTREEAEALFGLEGSPTRKCPGWVAVFNEVLCDYVVWQTRPTGVIDAGQAAWLLEQDDAARTLGSLALLVHIIAEAHSVPATFIHAVRKRAVSRWPGCEGALAMDGDGAA
jgi:hypothetical protein